MIERSLKYFPVRQVINEMLGIRSMRQMTPIEILHHTITNPLLNPYILWAMGSNMDAQEIISSQVVEVLEPSIDADSYRHFAARAMQRGDFTAAEKIYETARSKLNSDNDESDYFYYDVFRIYFLLSAGELIEAKAVMNEFIYLDDDEGKRKTRREKIHR